MGPESKGIDAKRHPGDLYDIVARRQTGPITPDSDPGINSGYDADLDPAGALGATLEVPTDAQSLAQKSRFRSLRQGAESESHDPGRSPSSRRVSRMSWRADVNRIDRERILRGLSQQKL